MPRVGSVGQKKVLYRALGDWIVILAGLLLHNGLTAVTLFVVARQVNPAMYGQYVAVYALLSFLVVIPGLGLDTWFLAQHFPTQEQFSVHWRSSLKLRGLALLIWLVLMGFLGIILPQDTYPWRIWLPTAVSVAFDSFSLLSFSALRIQNQHKFVTIWQAVFAVALFGAALWLPYSESYLVAFANSRMILSALLGLCMFAYQRQSYNQIQGTLEYSNHGILREGRPFMLAELASAVYVRADVSIVSLILSNTATALYGPAINLLQASFLAPRALFLLILPLLSKAFHQDLAKFKRYSTLQIGIHAAVGATISVALFIFAENLLAFIFKEAYLGSAQYLRLLSPIPFLRALNFGIGTVLAASNRQKLNTQVQIIVAIFNITANLAVIFPLGLVGVCLVYITSDMILLLTTSFLLWRGIDNTDSDFT